MKILPVFVCLCAMSWARSVPYYGGVSHNKAQLGHDLGISNVRQHIHPFKGDDYGHNFGLAGNLFGNTVDGKHGPATGKNLHLLGLGHTNYRLGGNGINKHGFGPKAGGQFGFHANQVGKGLGSSFGGDNGFGHFTNGKTKVVFGRPVHNLNGGNGYTGAGNGYNTGHAGNGYNTGHAGNGFNTGHAGNGYQGTGHAVNPYNGGSVYNNGNTGNVHPRAGYTGNGYNGIGHIGTDYNVHVAPHGGNRNNPVGGFYGAVKKIDPSGGGYNGPVSSHSSPGYFGTDGKVFDGLLGNVGNHAPSLPHGGHGHVHGHGHGGHKNVGIGAAPHKPSHDLFSNYGTGSDFGLRGEDSFHNLGLGLQSGSGKLNVLGSSFNGFNVKG